MDSSSSGPDGAGDTSLFMTAASYASDGPTLPIIIGGAGARPDGGPRRSRKNGPADEEAADARPAKMQRTEDGDAGAVPSKKEKAKAKVEIGALYEPWTLLPADVRRRVEKSMGVEGNWGGKVDVVVWTKNQNVKSGINRLKSLLGFEGSIQGASGDGLIAVSACGEGTTKLVGIVEMAKRVVCGAAAPDAESKSKSGKTWYSYVILSGTSPEDGKGRVPVLTVWLSRKAIPELSVAFGEQTFRVDSTESVG